MSFNSLATQVRDIELAARVDACVQEEARNNPTLSATTYAESIRSGGLANLMVWPVCIATEAEYASALLNNHAHPGQDESVVSDSQILSAVQASWPPDPEEAP